MYIRNLRIYVRNLRMYKRKHPTKDIFTTFTSWA